MKPNEPIHFEIDGRPHAAIVRQVLYRGTDRARAPDGEFHAQWRELTVILSQQGAIILRDRTRAPGTPPRTVELRWTVYADLDELAAGLPAGELEGRALRAVERRLRQIEQAVEV